MPNISKITLPNGVTYDIVDPVARESASAGMSLVVVSELPTASATTKGAIYLVAHEHEDSDDTYDEYVTVESGTTTKTYTWEKIGNTDVDLSTTTDNFIKSVTKTTNKLVTTTVPNVTGNSSVTATNTVFGTATTASKATAGTAIAVAKVGTAKSIPNVTGNSSVTASKATSSDQVNFYFSVASETLTIGVDKGTPSTTPTVSIPQYTFSDVTATNTTLGTAISIAPAVSAGNITPYTFEDVTVPVVTSNTSVTATNTTLGTAITVANGSVSSNGTGDTVVTNVTTTSGSAVTKIGKDE